MTGRISEIGRFPVKSMLGESPVSVTVDESGIAGDRVHALIDSESGKVASAKDPRRWAGLLRLRATYIDSAAVGAPIAIELDDGAVVRSDAPDVDERLSAAIGRPVRLVAAPPEGASYDDVWPDIEGLAPADFIEGTKTSATDDGLSVSTLPVGLLAPGTFQDLAPITLLTTASLRAGARLHPGGRWDPRRFRPNLLVDVDGEGFVENDWAGCRLEIGAAVLEVTVAAPRCVMTTLAQEELPADREILRTLARNNRLDVSGMGVFTCLGMYASVVQGGAFSVGDEVRLIR